MTEFSGPVPTGVFLRLLLYELYADQEGVRITGTLESSDGREVSFDTGNRKEMEELKRKWRTEESSRDA